MLHGTIRSTIPCGTISAVRRDFDPAGFTVWTGGHSGPQRRRPADRGTSPVCGARGAAPGRAVLLLAHETATRCSAPRSTSSICRDAALRSGTVVRSFKDILIEKGNLEALCQASGGRGHLPHRPPGAVYHRTHGVIAVRRTAGSRLYGSIQCPYYVHKALVTLRGTQYPRAGGADRDRRRLRGEGGVSLDAGGPRRAARPQGAAPVKIVYDRVEDMEATTKRQPRDVGTATAVGRTAGSGMEIEVIPTRAPTSPCPRWALAGGHSCRRPLSLP